MSDQKRNTTVAGAKQSAVRKDDVLMAKLGRAGEKPSDQAEPMAKVDRGDRQELLNSLRDQLDEWGGEITDLEEKTRQGAHSYCPAPCVQS